MSLRRLLAALLIVAAAPAGWLASRVEVDNRLERWTAASAAERELHEELVATYGSDEFVVVVVRAEDLFDRAFLDALVATAEAMERVPGVVEARGMPLVYRDLLGGEDPRALRHEMSSTPFYEGLFLAADHRSAAIWAEVAPPAQLADRRQVVAGVRAAAEPLEELGYEVAFAGSTALIVALDELSESESRRAFLVALVASLAALLVVLRSLRAALVAGVAAGVSVLLTLAAVAASGKSLNMITSVLPALLWVLALSGAIHLLRRTLRHRDRMSAPDAVRCALSEVRRPLVLAAVTTACGFLSLVVADMAPVRELGVFAAFGIMAALAVNLSVVPVLAELVGLGSSPAARRRGRLGLAAFALARPRTVLVAAAVFAAILLALIPHIEVASDPLAFLPPDHPTVMDYRTVAETVGAFYTMELVVDLPQQWTAPQLWPPIEELVDAMAASAIVPRVISPLDLLRKLNQWAHFFDPAAYRLPADRDAAEALLAELEDDERSALAGMVRGDGRQLRLSVLVNAMNQQTFRALVDDARRRLARLPEGFRGRVTGQVLLLVDAQQALVSSQLKSLGLALLIVFAVIAVGLRSWRLTLLSVFPNLLPLLSGFALMALCGLPLDAATVMMASVALGIAVDDTVHLLAALHGATQPAEVAAAVRRVAPAMLVTTVAACIGFFALCASSFVPIRDFGLLSGVAMVVALVADLLVIPAMLVLRSSRSRPGVESLP